MWRRTNPISRSARREGRVTVTVTSPPPWPAHLGVGSVGGLGISIDWSRTGPSLLGGLGALLHGLDLDGLVEALEDRLGAVLDLGVGGAGKANSSARIVGVELDVRVDQLDPARLDLLDRAAGADRAAVGADPAGVLKDRGDLADQIDLVGPAVLLAEVERRQARDVGGQRGGRRERLLVGADQALAVLQVPRRTQTGLPSSVACFLLVELDRLAEADQEGFGAGEAQLGDDLLADLASSSGDFSFSRTGWTLILR